MSSITNVNNNSSVVNVGRTTPVSPGPQTAEKSIPVVMASDQTAIPVEEQNKVQSEVALSLLGIPRAEVALGIFADVNTYDVNPTEWSMSPEYHVAGYGVKHLPTEAGALVEAPRNKTSVLTSKRFFRYQPGRVSAATFGVRSSVGVKHFAQNPVIRKYGIYDNFDGYYWETRNSGKEDNFAVVRRTQSVAFSPVSLYGIGGVTPLRGDNPAGQTVGTTQVDDYRIVGKGASETETEEGYLPADRKIITELKYKIIDNALFAAHNQYPAVDVNFTTRGGNTVNAASAAESSGFSAAGFSSQNEYRYYIDLSRAINADTTAPDISAWDVREKCRRDLAYWIDNFLKDVEYSSTSATCKAHTKINLTNFALSDGTNWTPSTAGYKVGIFPKVTRFEEPVHKALRQIFKVGKFYDGSDGQTVATGDGTNGNVGVPTGADLGLSQTAKNLLGANTTGIAQITEDQFDADDFYAGVDGIIDTLITTGSAEFAGRNKLDVLFEVKKNFWAYFVTTKDAINGNTIVYNPPQAGPSSPTALGLSNDETAKYIQYKCQRDVGYIIDGYKNDIIGGGNAETVYNASMFVRGAGLSVYSQRVGDVDTGGVTEKVRHTTLQGIIKSDLTVFGYPDNTSAEHEAFDTLSNLIIGNFDSENTKAITTGDRAFPGNLVALRDGLLHIHAGVYDPSLLKAPKLKVVDVESISQATDPSLSGAVADGAGAARFTVTEGVVTFGQHVKLSWTGGSSTVSTLDSGANQINNGEVLTVKRVFGPKGCEFTLAKEDGTSVNLNVAEIDKANGRKFYIDTTVPFIFPKDYDIEEGFASGFTSAIDIEPSSVLADASSMDTLSDHRVFRTYATNLTADGTGTVPYGAMFPYMYATKDDLNSTNFYNNKEYVGFINTALDPQLSSAPNNPTLIRSQIDNVNFYPEYVNWIKNNVKPEYWGVYEYRVPRSRFSHDALNGVSKTTTAGSFSGTNRVGTRNRVYSDLATGATGTARPGENYSVTDGVPEKQDSLYDFDFTKVTMLKIEFSWYGAVGALFLAYVPVGNGEARWVRVHHLRASNQLKIASLGNATLPITYTTYGGGSQYCLGDLGDQTLNQVQQGYGSISHNIVKYGASYYIDGGDRGTVRLFSYNNDTTVNSQGKQFLQVGATYTAADTTISGEAMPSVTITSTDDAGDTIDPRFFIGASVSTASRLDQGIKVVWADATKVYLSGTLVNSTVTLLPDRAQTTYGLETKKVILSTREGNAVRNRVQVYPTKLSAANLGNNTVRCRFKKSPIFQNLIAPSGTLKLSAEHTIDGTNASLAVTESAAPYINNGDSLYGWFRGRVEAASVTVFGRLYKEGDLYYFESLQSIEGTVVLKDGANDFFLHDYRFYADGDQAGMTDVTKTTTTIDGLSSLKIASNTVVPIPNTGTNIATLYLQQGTEQFDLGAYFDYNKEYLSFPLTDIAESLYFATDADTANSGSGEATDDPISLGVTWEEQ